MSKKELDKKTTLTPLIVGFIDNYIKNGKKNAAQAMRDAGYGNGKPEKQAAAYACLILARQDVKDYIAKREKEISMHATVTPEWVVMMAKIAAIKALKGHPVCDKDGNVLFIKPDYNGLNGALNVIAKVTGMEKTKVEHEVKTAGVGLVMHFEGKTQQDEREN